MNFPASSPPPDHVALQTLLAARDWELSAAELHGSLCGYLSAHGAVPGLKWLDAIVDAPVTQELVESERRLLTRLGDAALHALEEGEFTFSPLLPDDEQALGARVSALGQWCDGFVGGLGLGGMPRKHGLTATGREALDDLGRIARADVSLDDDGDADEQAFVEVLEFVRVSAVLVYEELRAARQGSQADGPRLRGRERGSHGHRTH